MNTVAGEQNQGVGLVGRLLRVFYAPSEAFAGLRVDQHWLDWFVPVILAVLFALASTYITMPIVVKTQSAVVQERLQKNPNLSAEQREQIMQKMEKFKGVTRLAGLAVIPVTSFATLFILAAILQLVNSTILNGTTTYKQMLAISGYSFLVTLPELLVRTPLILAKETMMVYTGLGVLISEEMQQTFLGRIVAGVDLFGFWQVSLLAIGITVVGGISSRKSLTAILILWVLWIVLKAALAGLGTMFGQAG